MRRCAPALVIALALGAAGHGAVPASAGVVALQADLEAARAAEDLEAEARALRELAVFHADAGDLETAADFAGALAEVARRLDDPILEAVGEERVALFHDSRADFLAAATAFEKALGLYRRAGSVPGEARALYRLGSAAFRSGDFAAAESRLREAIAFAARHGDRRIEAESWNLLAPTLGRTGRGGEALAAYAEAIDGFRELGDELQLGRALHNLSGEFINQSRIAEAMGPARESGALAKKMGNLAMEASAEHLAGIALMETGEPRRSLEHFERSRTLGAQVAGFTQGAHIALSTATAQLYLGDHDEAQRSFEEAVSLARERSDPYLEAAALQMLAYSEQQVGRFEQAVDHLLTSLELRRRTGDRVGESVSRHGLALVFGALSDHERSMAEFAEALALQRELGYSDVLLTTLQNLSLAYYRQERFPEALAALEEAAGLLKASEDPRQEAEVRSQLGWVLTDLGRPAEAVAELRLAEATQRSADDPAALARTLVGRGRAQVVLADFEGAHSALEEALKLGRGTGDWASEVEALEKLSRLERLAGRLEAARERMQEALAGLEQQRSRLAADDMRSLFFGGHRYLFESYLELLHELHRARPEAGFDAEALAVSERSRARGLLDLIETGRVDLGGRIDSDLRGRERELRREIADTERRLAYLTSRGAGESEIAESVGRLERLDQEARDLEVRAWARNPDYAELRYPRPLDARSIQELLSEGTLLLQYALGDARSLLWAVTPSSLELLALPGRAELEARARSLHGRFATAGRAGLAALEAEADEVGRVLLGPLGERPGVERIVVVPDGALHYLPFAALPGLGARPMVSRIEVVQLPSASVLAGLRQRQRRRSTSPRIAVVADPVFRVDDPRVETSSGGRTSDLAGWTASTRASDLVDLARLPHSRREAEAIAELGGPSSTLVALDFDADRSAIESGRLESFDIAHFATHGVLNDRHPDRSGLVLSLVDRSGEPINGFLSAGRIFDLNLPLDLAVLSGCQTALGQEIEGEGLVGLTRAFFHAGAAGVLVSQWSVSDRATAELMSRFYRGLLTEGLAPAAALRRAQLSLRAEPRWRAPYYWAGFVLQGDWR